MAYYREYISNLSISEQEINDFISKPENQKSLEAAYTDNLTKYNKPEEVKARHILISGEDSKSLEKIKAIRSKVTVKNFSEMAKKETQDPSGKTNGGDLGWFANGRMVPEFEKVAFGMKKGEISEPVKTQFGYHIILVEDKKAAEIKPLESVKTELAKIEIQKTKAQDLDKLLKSTGEEIQALLAKNDFSAVESISKKVDGQIYKNIDVNQFEQSLTTTSLAPQEADQIFKAQDNTILNFGNPGTIFLVKVIGHKTGAEKTPDELKAEVGNQNQLYSRKVREELIKALNNKAKIVTNSSLM
jgi:parvulin-like peptidyl-prolyl isomerase